MASAPIAFSQDDFTEDLEAELEAEIGLSEEDLSSDDEDFEDIDEDSAESASSDDDFEKAIEDEVTEESQEDGDDFAEEDFDEEFAAEEEAASEDFGDEDFGEESFDDEDFSEESFSEEEFGDDDFDEFADEKPVADETVPIDDSFGDTELVEEPAVEVDENAPEDLEFQQQEEESQAFDQASPAEEFNDISSAGPTEPNLEYEAKLYDVYVNYHASPTPNLEWQSLVGERRSEMYNISSGDTLWGISETFFGDGNYWPKVWSINSKIKNPHMISPGNRIAFVMGTETDAPMFTVTEPDAVETDEGEGGGEQAEAGAEGEGSSAMPEELSESDIEQLIEAGALSAQDTEQLQQMMEESPEEGSDVEEDQAMEDDQGADQDMDGQVDGMPDIDIPPPSVVSRPVLKRLPPSVPEWQSADPSGIYDDAGIEYGVRPITKLKDTLYLQSFIDDSLDNSDATVVETQRTGYFGSDLEYVYVKFPKGRGRLGRKYLVVDPKGKIRSPLESVETSDLGFQKTVSGLVTIESRVAASVTEQYEVFKAIVTKSVNPITVGSQLLRGELPIVNLEKRGPRSNQVAMVIGGTAGKRRTVFGDSSIVYLNRGSKEGIREGQILDVRANRRSRSRDTLIIEAQRVIGQVKIVKTAARFATAVVLTSSDPIMAGDLTGVGPYVPRAINQLAKSGSGASTSDDSNLDVGDDELEGLLDDEDMGDDTSLGDDSDFDDIDLEL